MINLSKREENPTRYDINRDLNTLIADYFNESKKRFEMKWYPEDISIVTGERINATEGYEDVPYGVNTIGKAGCAVLCFEHGLRTRGIKCKVEDLAKEIADKGYYRYGYGTYHNLFDHFGLKRVTDVAEVMECLEIGKVVTILVKNHEYSQGVVKEGSHFVNIVGKVGEKFVIEDSSIGSMIAIDINIIFEATRVAWMW